MFKFKADNENVNFSKQFSLGSISNGISATESIRYFSQLQFCWWIWHIKHSQVFNDYE